MFPVRFSLIDFFPEKRALLFQRSDLAASCTGRKDLKNKVFSADFCVFNEIRSSRASSDLKNRSARFSGLFKAFSSKRGFLR